MTFAVWEQVRAALTATQLSASARAINATTVSYERTLDPTGRRVLEQSASVRTDFVTQPWRSISPDTARRVGYVVTDRDGSITYYAPGLDIFLSGAFAEDHCFGLTRSPDPTRIGITFQPAPGRQTQRSVAGIRGTLWLDRQSAEVRALEFRYVNASSAQEEHAGGAMEFVRLRNGAWAIARWSLRMPALEYRVRSRQFGGSDTTVAEIKVRGGELALATRGPDTLWAQPPLTLTGSVVEATSGSPIAAARVSLAGTRLAAATDLRGNFMIPGVLTGMYTVEVRTPSLDSIGAAHSVALAFTDSADVVQLRVPTGGHILVAACGKTRLDAPGIVVGTITMRGDSTPPQRSKVVAEWVESSVRPGVVAVSVDRQTRWLETRADTLGAFRLCGVRVNTALVLRAEQDGAGSAPVDVRVAAGARFARADLLLDRTATRAAVFAGLVLSDTTQRPISEAEITFPSLLKRVLSNEAGAFRLVDIPPGTHRVLVRRLGYGPLDTSIVFRANQTVDRRIVLRGVVALDSVRVTAESPLLRSFDEHRKMGLGHFLTREQLAKQEGQKLSDILSEVSSVRVDQGVGGRAWLSSTRKPPSLSKTDVYDREPFEVQQGMKARCFPKVYVDNQIMNPKAPTEPFDVNSISPDRIEAIEWYAGPSQTPLEYSRLDSACGVLVIWTRRSL